jgi:hypothetical protein
VRCGHPELPQTACPAAIRADPPQNVARQPLASIQECLARLGHQAQVVEVVPFVLDVPGVNQSQYVKSFFNGLVRLLLHSSGAA